MRVEHIEEVTHESVRMCEITVGIGDADDKIVKVKRNSPQVLKDLLHILEMKSSYKSHLERFLDAEQLKNEAHTLFSHGYMKLEEWAQAENIFWLICADISKILKSGTPRIRFGNADRDVFLMLCYRALRYARCSRSACD